MACGYVLKSGYLLKMHIVFIVEMISVIDFTLSVLCVIDDIKTDYVGTSGWFSW